MIKGITVRLYSQNQGTPPETDPFGDPITTEAYVDVANVLVYPASYDAIVTDLQLYGKRAVYELCIPKGDTHDWEDKEVGFFNRRFRTFGPCIEYIGANTPTPWNRKVKVEYIE